MIRVERDARFWQAIAAHPEVAGRLGAAMTPEALTGFVRRDDVLPLAAHHGGFLFVRQGALGFTAELHTLFTPEGWGREALEAAVEAFNAVFLCGYQEITTFEHEANVRSRPPLSFGFKRAGDWRETPWGSMRLWTLTLEAWRTSPVTMRRQRSCH